MEREPTPDDEPTEVITPFIRIDDSITLTWANSRLRCFKDESLDHIDYRNGDGNLVGLRVARAVLDLMFEHDFPMQFDPIPDSHTRDWFVRSEMKLLDQELNDLG